MIDTDKKVCLMTASLVAAYGTSEVVISPGSRNAPLTMAMNRHPGLKCHTVVDERSAAFVALGKAAVSGRPVALVCTSGSALLNYAPALAEARYRQIPLIAISADRPGAWIDQNDSQTIRQPQALANVTLSTCDLTDDIEHGELASERSWQTWRRLNDVLAAATGMHKGPVHINIQLHEPLTKERDYEILPEWPKVDIISPAPSLSTDDAKALAARWRGKRILIVAGFSAPNAAVSKAMSLLASLPDVAVVAEGIANLHATGIHEAPDRILSGLAPDELDALRPDVVIYFGGSLVSRPLKNYLRSLHDVKMLRVGTENEIIDTFIGLTQRASISPEGFFPRLSRALAHVARTAGGSGDYARQWNEACIRAGESAIRLMDSSPWCDELAIREIINRLPSACNLQLGNGTSVRFALYNDLARLHRVDGNRGVSGIDGCVSTAIGAASGYKGLTVLVVGDMSMLYDIGALASVHMAPMLRIVVMNNGGGNIFRALSSIRDLPERDDYFVCNADTKLHKLAEAYGLEYFQACDSGELSRSLQHLLRAKGPSILEVVTDGDVSAQVMSRYLNRLNNK